jgi:hypothetical protein
MLAPGYAARRSALEGERARRTGGPSPAAGGEVAVCGSPTAHTGIRFISCSHPWMNPRLRLPCSEFFNKLKNL